MITVLTVVSSALIGASSAGAAYDFGTWEEWTPGPPHLGQWFTSLADVTGDGKTDAIAVLDGGIRVGESTGTQFANYAAWTAQPYSGSRGTFFSDVDGDRKADAIAVNDDQIIVRRSTGTSFGAYETWTSQPYSGSRGTFFADVTGDGKADAIAVNDDQIIVRRSTGTSFGVYELWKSGSFYGSLRTFFADVTGDGKADAIAVNDWGGIRVGRSNGTLFQSYPWDWTTRPFYGSRDTKVADLNGDHKADAIAVNQEAVVARLSVNFQFMEDALRWSRCGHCSGTDYFADVTGDGRADWIFLGVEFGNIAVRRWI